MANIGWSILQLSLWLIMAEHGQCDGQEWFDWGVIMVMDWFMVEQWWIIIIKTWTLDNPGLING